MISRINIKYDYLRITKFIVNLKIAELQPDSNIFNAKSIEQISKFLLIRQVAEEMENLKVFQKFKIFCL